MKKSYTRRRFITQATLAAGAVAIQRSLSNAATGPGRSRPNVLLIMHDDLNNYLGCYGGHPQALSPNIDALASSGARFANAFCPAGWCAPSRASLLTGISQAHLSFHGGDFAKDPVLRGSSTLMEYFRANGYHTAGVGKISHDPLPAHWNQFGHGSNYGPSAMFGEKEGAHPDVPAPYREIGRVDGSFGPLTPGASPANVEPGFTGWFDPVKKRLLRVTSDTDHEALMDEDSAGWFENWLQGWSKSGGKKPFFAGVGFMKPHTPMVVPKRYFDLFPLDSIALPPGAEEVEGGIYFNEVTPPDIKGWLYYRDLLAAYGGDRSLALRKFHQAYLASIAYADEQVGRVLRALENSPFAENTIVIHTADHGFQIGPKRWMFKNAPWDQALQVPLIVRVPGVTKPGSVIQAPASHIDLLPTLKELCGLQGETRKNENGRTPDGRSLAGFLSGANGNGQDDDGAVMAMIRTKPQEETLAQYTLRTREWRYIRYSNRKEELYDHRTGALEDRNVAGDPANAAIKASLLKRLIPMMAPVDQALHSTPETAA